MAEEDPIKVAQLRYAKGEITKEEYLELKKELSGAADDDAPKPAKQPFKLKMPLKQPKPEKKQKPMEEEEEDEDLGNTGLFGGLKNSLGIIPKDQAGEEQEEGKEEQHPNQRPKSKPIKPTKKNVCPNCRKVNAPDAVYCEDCGAKLKR